MADGKRFTVHLQARPHSSEFDVVVESDVTQYSRRTRLVPGGASVDGRIVKLVAQQSGFEVTQRGRPISVEVMDRPPVESSLANTGKRTRHRVVRAPLPGQVVNVLVDPGTLVQAGERLLVIEAMKMQNPIVAEHSGRVLTLRVAVGDAVQAGALLVELGD